uniref:Variant surface glycoprotein n=1 Tax=Trypanosoma brucei TaxID=5691 RepID=S5G3W7_9TRYP|nr:variant surface glycoprotein [Trypanosoma brucei]ARB51400.1 variant surface glycoprotein [Trypanosoma brucei]
MILRHLILTGWLIFCFRSAATTATDSTTVQDPCQEIVFNRQLAASLEARVVAAQARRAQLSEEAAAFLLAGCRQADDRTKTAYTLLAAIAGQRANKISGELNAKAATLQTAAATLRTRADQLQAALAHKTADSATLTHKTASAALNVMNSGTSKTCAVDISTTATNAHGCDVSSEQKAAITKDVEQIQKLTSYQATPDAAFALAELTATLEAAGNVGGQTVAISKGSKACGHTGDNNNEPSAVTVGFRLAKVTQGITWKTATKNKIKQGANEQTCEEDSKPEQHAFVSRKSAAFAICTARTITISMSQLLSDQKLNQLSDDPDVKTAASLVALGPSETAATDEAQRSAVKALLGEGEQTVHAKYLKGLEDNKMDFKIGTKAVKTGVISASTSSDFALAMGFCLGDQYRKQKAQKKVESNTETIPEKNKECKAETEQEKCNEKDGCEFKDGKCKLKDGMKVENDGKTTNTTASNSFVINKAHLLLAVLLF